MTKPGVAVNGELPGVRVDVVENGQGWRDMPSIRSRWL